VFNTKLEDVPVALNGSNFAHEKLRYCDICNIISVNLSYVSVFIIDLPDINFIMDGQRDRQKNCTNKKRLRYRVLFAIATNGDV